MPKKLPTRYDRGHVPYASSTGPRCGACLGPWPCEVDKLEKRVRALEAGLAHAGYVAREITTIAGHDEPSGVDDGRNMVLSVEDRLAEIVELVEAELLNGPSLFCAALVSE
jgi:hypothetical protein